MTPFALLLPLPLSFAFGFAFAFLTLAALAFAALVVGIGVWLLGGALFGLGAFGVGLLLPLFVGVPGFLAFWARASAWCLAGLGRMASPAASHASVHELAVLVPGVEPGVLKIAPDAPIAKPVGGPVTTDVGPPVDR